MKTYEMKVIFKSYSDYESGDWSTSQDTLGIWQWLEDHFIDPNHDELINVKLKVEDE